MIRADLHVHTYYSDGAMSPEEVVNEAKVNGLGFIAVTDHDCMLAYPEVAARCKAVGLKTAGGIEISAYEGGVKIHVLGYGADAENGAFKKFLTRLYDGSMERAEDIIRRLNANGVHISLSDALAMRHSEKSPLHTMHIARACVQKGYARNPYAFYSEYLAPGKRAFSCACRPSPESAVEAVFEGGGVSSLAHPGRIETDGDGIRRLVKNLKDSGLNGIEAVYATHTVTETAYYKEMAKAFSLTVTGGSDAHCKDGRHVIGTPEYYLDEALAEKIGI